MLVNTNVPELRALLALNRTTKDIEIVWERLSTGLRINHAKDDPSGIVVRDQLRSQIKGMESALKNTDAAKSVLSAADTGLGSISNQLIDLRGLLTSSTTTQSEIDAVLDTIDGIARLTKASNGKGVINGAMDYTTTGVDRTVVEQLRISGADLSNGATPVSIKVNAAAKRGLLTFDQTEITADTRLTVSGNIGQEMLTLTATMTPDEMVDTVNNYTSSTGVRARVDSGTILAFETSAMGQDRFVALESDQTLTITDENGDPATRSNGTDMIASVNGMYASAKGRDLYFSGPSFSFNATLAESVQDADTVSFAISGGGATFQLGPNVVANQQLKMGIPSASTWSLGGSSGRLGDLRSGGKADLATNRELASTILEEASNDLSSTRARIGSIQKNTLDVNTNNLEDQLLITTGAEERISATDYAAETSRWVRDQILAESAISVVNFARQYAKYALAFL